MTNTFVDIGEQVESMIKSGKVKNLLTTQLLALFYFFHQGICFFPVCFFPIDLKPLFPVFVTSHSFSPINCDVNMQVQN